MTFSFSVPKTDDLALNFGLALGERIYILGANGSGKSSLMHKFYIEHLNDSRRISAHRQTWLESNAITLSPKQKQQTEQNMKAQDANPDARWKDSYSAQRASISIYDLIDAENIRARAIAASVDADDFDLAKELRKKDSPIKAINSLLKLSNIHIELSIRANEQVVAIKGASQPYSIAELSDGERNAVLIAANVLTVAPGTLVLIDEPERHLHRAIISPLLANLFAERPDCAFVISTHEPMLPIDDHFARTLLVRGCKYLNDKIASWDVDLIKPDAEIDDAVRRDILGARRTILFVEGTQQSLDQPLYSLIFPNISVVPKEASRDVEAAVSGVRSSSDFHWVAAFGIVDGDGRATEEVEELVAKGVYALPLFSVESLYYDPFVQKRAAQRLAESVGGDVELKVIAARTAALSSLEGHVQRLSERRVEKTLRNQVLRQMPTSKTIATGQKIQISLDVPTVVAAEKEKLERLITTKDLTQVIARYPVRETPMLGEISRMLGFKDRNQYQSAVLKALAKEPETLAHVRGLLGTLAIKILSA